MVIERVGSTGDPAVQQIDEIISAVAGRPPEETLEALDRYGMQWHVSKGGDLLLRSWQVVAKGFVSPEQAAEIRIGREMPKEADYLEWLSSNLDELRRFYAGQWIAIAEGRVIASAPSLPELVEAAETAGIERPFVTFISEQETTWDMAYDNQVF
jgi:hypothetical protein